MRSRFATAFTLVALVGGTGGAIAVGAGGSHNSSQGAATAQYKPGKGCGDKNHQHAKHNQCKPKKHSKGKGASKGKSNHKGKGKHKHGHVKGVSVTRHAPGFTG